MKSWGGGLGGGEVGRLGVEGVELGGFWVRHVYFVVFWGILFGFKGPHVFLLGVGGGGVEIVLGLSQWSSKGREGRSQKAIPGI